MSVHSPDVGLILYLDVLAQSALPDKRPCHARNRVPMPKDRFWLWIQPVDATPRL
jgi:hypothetical protein